MCQDLASEVEKLLGSSNAYIRKKAALGLLRICRKCPHMTENFLDRIASLLNDRSHGVLAGTRTHAHTHTHTHTHLYVCMYVCMYVYIYILCMYMSIYINLCLYI